MTLDSIRITRDHGTVIEAQGYDESGKLWRFAGDRRPMIDLANAIDNGDSPQVWVDSWQVLGPGTEEM